jgi:RNA polymerase sigma factor (sigma-70 family)
MRTNPTNAGFTASPADSANRETTIVAHMYLVRTVAKGVLRCVPSCVTIDDLIGAGTIGLVQAVDRYDATRGSGFSTYAKHRIIGAMLDYLRGDDPLSRSERSRVRHTEPETKPATISLDQFGDHFPALASGWAAPRFPPTTYGYPSPAQSKSELLRA